ncbi:MAG: formate dehydrogenase accessory sulfurtransferase FdhD [Ruminococcus sp.]|nr:formate dehydrogenase accessory sulfurtransferase FdhD [Ruminococcus sp.]
MEKKTILIQKIRESQLIEKEDEVAIEQQIPISFLDGRQIQVTCTPTYIEEMVLSRRFLAGDFTAEEKNMYVVSEHSPKTLMQVETEEIFRIAKDSFENPGPLFVDTGCAHSCALVQDGKVLCCIEDIGRHNALDKVIGYALKHQISMANSYVFTSGRISKDYLQKAIAAGFPMVVSRAAVTDSAVELAKEKQVTLLGFIRKNTGNLYCEGSVKIR